MQALACDLLDCLATDVLPNRPVSDCHPAPAEHEAREAGDFASAIMDALDKPDQGGNSSAGAASGAVTQADDVPLRLSAAACIGQLVPMLAPEQQRGEISWTGLPEGLALSPLAGSLDWQSPRGGQGV